MQMKRIWKFPLAITDVQSVAMPRGARILAVDEQHGALTLWAEVDPSQPKVTRIIHIIGTGNPMPEHLGDYLGTAVIDPFVWHVYEDGAR